MQPGPEIVTRVAEVRAAVEAARAAGRAVALVPTMGALHAGHAALIRRARDEVDERAAASGGGLVVVSIFVNPTQFGPSEDFQSYPRDPEGDVRTCRETGADLVFMPPVEEVYGSEHRTQVEVRELGDVLCGASRPGHFRGVATVVTMLFGMVRPDLAVFGEKDYQQLQVIRRLTRDLYLGVQIVGHPTVREPDGLALSSRNRYLGPTERAQAAALHRALEVARQAHAGGERRPGALAELARALIAREAPLGRIDYVEVRDADTLEALAPEAPSERPLVVALAVRLGRARLIDNAVLSRSS